MIKFVISSKVKYDRRSSFVLYITISFTPTFTDYLTILVSQVSSAKREGKAKRRVLLSEVEGRISEFVKCSETAEELRVNFNFLLFIYIHWEPSF